MSELKTLESAYREAQSAFSGDQSDENRAAYKAAKQAFVDARTAHRKAEEEAGVRASLETISGRMN